MRPLLPLLLACVCHAAQHSCGKSTFGVVGTTPTWSIPTTCTQLFVDESDSVTTTMQAAGLTLPSVVLNNGSTRLSNKAGWEALKTALALGSNKVQELTIKANNMDADGAAYLATGITSHGSLVKLEIADGNFVGDAGAASIAGVLSTTTLTHLVLTDNHVGNAGVQSIATAAKTDYYLKVLDLSRNGQITKVGAQSLVEVLQANTNLEELWLNDCAIGDTGAVALAGALANTNFNLRVLKLESNQITDVGAKALSTAIAGSAASGLQHLALGGNWVGDPGATDLAQAAAYNPIFQTLDLNNNEVGRVGALALADTVSRSTSGLQSLVLQGNGGVGADATLAITKAFSTRNVTGAPGLS